MPQEIQVGRFSGLLHKLLGMREGSPAPYLAPDIIATLPLEVERPEWLFLGGQAMGMRREISAADPANFSFLSLENPIGSGALLVVESVMSNIAAASYRLQASPPLGGGSAGAQLDLRSGLFPDVVTTVGQSAAAVAVALPGTRVGTVTLLQAVPYFWPFVLPPGTALVVGGIVVNQAVEILFRWRERAIEPSELR